MLTYSCFWNFHCTLKYFRRNIFSSGAWYISEIQTTKNLICALAKNFFFNFRIYQIFSYFSSSADFCSTKFMFTFAFFFQAKYFQCSSRLKTSFQHANFSAFAEFCACADFSAYPHSNFYHNVDCFKIQYWKV